MLSNLQQSDWEKISTQLDISGKLFIDGHNVNAIGGEVFDCINPANGKSIASISRGQGGDIDLAVASAKQAWEDGRWRKLSGQDRKEVLLRLADLIGIHQQELALLESMDMGKPITDVLNIDLPEVIRTLRFFAECIDKIEGGVTNAVPDSLHLIMHEPIGIVGAITPWNYPLLMAVWKIAPALAAGNCLVLKPSELAPLTCTRLAQLFIDAGGPPGVFNVINGLGVEAGTALALHPDVRKLTFTGSTAVGKLLMQYSGQSNLKRIALETGGKSPQIFMPDLYDLDVAVDRAVGGIYDNAGQVCNAGSRLLVHQSIYDEFVEKFISRTSQAYQPGNPLNPLTTLGPLANQKQRSHVLGHVKQALAEGASLAMGSANITEDDTAYFSPCLFVGVTNAMQIVRQEVFGPVATVQSFATESEALALANDSDFGLAASVWSSDLKTAHRMVGALEAGVVWVNCFGDGDMTQPFGGYKQSGNSRDKHMNSLKSYMETKSAWFSLG